MATTFAPEVQACVQAFQGALRDTYVTAKGATLFSDTKAYFTSDQFESDYNAGKWNGAVTVIADAVPIGLSAGASHQDISTFQSKISQAQTVVLDTSTYTTLSISTGNLQMANAFNDCMSRSAAFGPGIAIESDDDSNLLTFTLSYRKVSSHDPSPTIASAQVTGLTAADTAAVLKFLKPGTVIQDKMSVNGTRVPTQEVSIVVNTSNGLSVVQRLAPAELTLEALANPIGTIITSILDFETFSTLTKNHAANPAGKFSTIKSKWAPCDGRSIVGSAYQANVAKTVLPDLRGCFVRGLNEFASDPDTPVGADRANPAGQVPAGTFQADGIGSHQHSYGTPVLDPFTAQPGGDSRVARKDLAQQTTGANSGAVAETRPKNVSAYFYVRIN